jgi:hypothetical protein
MTSVPLLAHIYIQLETHTLSFESVRYILVAPTRVLPFIVEPYLGLKPYD